MQTPVGQNLSIDEGFMARALQVAELGRGFVEPNPMVGCVIVRDGEIIAEGFHQRFGGPHAEVEALRSADPRATRESTAYVSLEPCCHHGKTPPCSEALIQAGVKRVVLAMKDPFAKVDGGGIQQLASAGIEVTAGVLESNAIELNAPYLKLVKTGKPWVIAKWAMTLDGKIATRTGNSRWITNSESRLDVHRTRARVDAVIVGMGTVRADDPTLNARLPDDDPIRRVAERVIFCRSGIPSPNCRLMKTAREIPTCIIAGPSIPEDEILLARSHKAKVIRIQQQEPQAMVHDTLLELGKRGMTNVLLEGGGDLVASFQEANAIDEFHVYLAPRLVGGREAPGPVGGSGVELMSEAQTLERVGMTHYGDDLKITYRRRQTGDQVP
ncbi:bifunctional diaminohydroxyphosphoribosylaminopyrimidine deaminase/5-amino-6-(5-phosphoribosylamino)uracil reductase RibD [bacterium]|nr:bifunctional diaminohydroxyphosphoribosylaminopyrimidine deaminase/5-amino-6-(5-phosphoribosylamino)uracil reductase RibD [bacterium]